MIVQETYSQVIHSLNEIHFVQASGGYWCSQAGATPQRPCEIDYSRMVADFGVQTDHGLNSRFMCSLVVQCLFGITKYD